jgi:D-aminopeptidase
MKFSGTTQPEVLLAIPGMKQEDGTTVSYEAKNMEEAYPLIRLMYKYVKP